MDIIRIPLRNYVHIKDTFTNITYLVEGAKNYALKSNEVLVKDITPHIQLGKSQYIVIVNPVVRTETGVARETFGQVKLRWGEEEIRIDQDYKDPFPLYPGEEIRGKISDFVIVQANEELKLMAVRPFYDNFKKKQRKPGDQWMLRGPINYIPRVEVQSLKKIQALIVRPNTAIKLRACRDCIDKYGNKRKAGEEWLVREAGSYLPNTEEEIVDSCVKAYTLTDKVALHLRASCEFVDVYGNHRKAGDEWLVTIEDNDLHIPDVHEIVVKKVDILILSSRQYCVIINPVVDGKPQYGKKLLRRGETSFFLQPGEELEDKKIKEVIVLDENDALLLKAREPFYDGKVKRIPGERWMIKGPCEFILPLELELLEKRKAIPLDENEGIYVRDIFTGNVKMISGQTYLLAAHEELYEKELSPVVEDLLSGNFAGTVFASAEVDEKGEIKYNKNKISKEREKFRVVTFRAPDNSAVQVFDYKNMTSRIVFGPELIKLGPHEEFTVVNLSGKKPKVENQIRNIAILLGPDFMTDIIEVETRDHARLRLQLCYSWKFEVKDKSDHVENTKLFNVNDFVGDACKNLAAKIRGTVSGVSFEEFHKSSATLVRQAIFGSYDKTNMTKTNLKFEANNLVIINVDIQTQEPCDPKTRESLSKSTNLSIQSINQLQKADAEFKQKYFAEESKGNLDISKIKDDTKAESENIEFLKKKVDTEVVKTSGQLVAKANAIAKSNEIQGESMVEQSRLKVEALEIEIMSNLNQEYENIQEEIKRNEQIIDVELEKLQKLTTIEVDEFKKTINAIGKETIVAMAGAGPQLQAKLLNSLGIKSFLITDGKNPINLFNTAKGLIQDK
jgi:major vault protein